MSVARSIRAATVVDADQIRSCMEAAYTGYQPRMGGERLPPMDVDYAAEIENFPCWVIASGQDILGALIMVFDDAEASIANIAVDPKYQRQGIGGELMRFAEATASQRGFTTLHLATHVLLTENIALYRHLGWQQAGRDETRVYMKKSI